MDDYIMKIYENSSFRQLIDQIEEYQNLAYRILIDGDIVYLYCSDGRLLRGKNNENS